MFFLILLSFCFSTIAEAQSIVFSIPKNESMRVKSTKGKQIKTCIYTQYGIKTSTIDETSHPLLDKKTGITVSCVKGYKFTVASATKANDFIFSLCSDQFDNLEDMQNAIEGIKNKLRNSEYIQACYVELLYTRSHKRIPDLKNILGRYRLIEITDPKQK